MSRWASRSASSRLRRRSTLTARPRSTCSVSRGGSAESASELVAIFQRYTPALDEATTRLGRFQRALAGQEDVLDVAAPGGKTAAAYLQEFGVQATDASGKVLPTLNVLEQLADGFQRSAGAAQKTPR